MIMKRIFTLAMSIMAIFVIAQNQRPSQCENPKAHEFDFWIGNWTVYKNGTDQIVGYNNIVPVIGGCGIQENWKSAGGNTGTSLNKFNFGKGKWQQFWIDDSGGTLELEGNYSDDKMILTGSVPSKGQRPALINKITWFKNSDGSVRQFWEQSKDDGKTWTVSFDGLYKK
jgi:hypothetical protein